MREEKDLKDEIQEEEDKEEIKEILEEVKTEEEYIEKVIKINRVCKVVAGGKRFSFTALVVVGDGRGSVGYGYCKAKDVRQAIEKARRKAIKTMRKISLKGTTIPHEVIGKCKASEVLLKPASPGTGVIAGRAVRAVVEAVGIKDILTKSLRSHNPLNLVKATFNGLISCKTKEEIEGFRKG
ncbi:MAG: 30S ribosomal protein S5 [Caldiserica bacterium]|nr:MAG: 30S ribosomal protein S5 [Caldisericota bacterium]